MRRPAIACTTVILAVLTAVTLVRAAAVVTDARIEAPVEGSGKGVARAFYRSMDVAVRNGDLDALDAVVSPDLVVQRTGVVDTWDEAAFAAHVAEVHDAYPALQIVVDDLVADRDRVFARIHLTGDEGMGLRGFPVAQTQDAGFTDVLRIADGRVVAYRGVAADLTPAQPVLHETFEAGTVESAAVGVARLTLEPGAGFDGSIGPGPTIYVVETGRVSFEVHGVPFISRATGGTPFPSESLYLGSLDHLGPGDQIAIWSGASYSFHATADAPAVLMAMTLMSPDALALPATDNSSAATPARMPTVAMYLAADLIYPSASWPTGVVSQPLVGGLSVDVPHSTFVVTIHLVTLAPSAVIAEPAANGFEMVAVEAGNGVMTTIDHGTEGAIATMTVGSADVIEAGAGVAIRNAGDAPLVLLVLSFAPSDGLATLAIPPAGAGGGRRLGIP